MKKIDPSQILENTRRKLAQTITRKSAAKTDSSMRYTTATGPNQIFGRTYPAFRNVVAGQWVGYHREGGDWVIIGPIDADTDWATLTLAIGAQTIVRTPEWRVNARKIELRGEFTRTAAMAAGTTIANFGGSNPPAPATNIPGWGLGTIVASTPDNQPVALQAHSSLGLRTTTTTFALAIGDGLALDTMSWPV